jgi:hypothetical protein
MGPFSEYLIISYTFIYQLCLHVPPLHMFIAPYSAGGNSIVPLLQLPRVNWARAGEPSSSAPASPPQRSGRSLRPQPREQLDGRQAGASGATGRDSRGRGVRQVGISEAAVEQRWRMNREECVRPERVLCKMAPPLSVVFGSKSCVPDWSLHSLHE